MSNDERDKLKTLLNYWIAHNKEHGQEFREWAGTAKGFGEAEASEEASLAAAGETEAEEHAEMIGALAEYLDKTIHR